jgi:hypothetical protein
MWFFALLLGSGSGHFVFQNTLHFLFHFPHDALWMNIMVKQNLRKICTLFLRQLRFCYHIV